jgi:hypothetical protein
MLIRLWAFLTRRRLVWCYAYPNIGKRFLCIADVYVDGGMDAELYWPFSIRRVRLYPDGSSEDYIQRWRWAERSKEKTE